MPTCSQVFATVLFALLFARFLPVSIPLVEAGPGVTNVTLYAHETANGTILDGRPDFGGQKFRDITKNLTFTLDPSLGFPVGIFGSLTIRIHVRSDLATTGIVSVTVAELKATREQLLIAPRLDAPESLDFRTKPVTFVLSRINYTLSAGSRILLNVGFPTPTTTSVQVVFDEPGAATGLILPLVDPVTIESSVFDTRVVAGKVVESAPTSERSAFKLRVEVRDVFGVSHLRNMSVTVLDRSGDPVMKTNLDFAGFSHITYNAIFSFSLNVTRGTYVSNVSVHDQSENAFVDSRKFWVATFADTSVFVSDVAGRALPDSTVIARLSAADVSWTATTNETGWASFRLPESVIVGWYEMGVSWSGILISPSIVSVTKSGQEIRILFPAYDYTAAVTITFLGLAVPGAQVELFRESQFVKRDFTLSDGTVTFRQIPEGSYALKIQFLGLTHETSFDLRKATTETIKFPLPLEAQLPFIIIPLAVAVPVLVAVRRRSVLQPVPFNYFEKITNGGLPLACTTTIVGAAGAGKTVIAGTLAQTSLEEGRSCVFITNNDFPSKLREHFGTIGLNIKELEQRGKFVFIDCYTGLAGKTSPEKYAVPSVTDLTSLGIKVSSCIEELGESIDVFLDSLTPLLDTLRPEYVVTFLETIGAKVKAASGRLIATVGTSVDKQTLSRLEESSDCVIESQRLEGRAARGGRRWRLRVKKLRGRPYDDRWVPFTVESGKGISFYAPKP